MMTGSSGAGALFGLASRLLTFLAVLWMGLAGSIAGADRSLRPSAATETKLVSIRVIPKNRTLTGKKASQQFIVMGKLADGQERDLTAQVSFALSDGAVARIDDEGRAFPLADGETELTAALGDHKATAVVNVKDAAVEPPFSFARDIGGILTRRGCNSSGCHGGVKGQAGFKLSVNAIHPREDYKWIVEGGIFQVLTEESGGPQAPRINLEKPEDSLLLQKPTMAIVHGGGMRFETGSDDYEAILGWVRNGAPYGEDAGKAAAKIESLEVFPANLVLRPGEKQRLLVTAHRSDGRQEDFTHLVLYESNDSGVAEVTPGGLLEAVEPGETAILIKAAGRSARAAVGIVGDPISDYPEVPARNFIDEQVFSKLRKFNIIPSELSSDSKFLRRVCLDLTGTLPPPNRVREFLADNDPRKRGKLIETLLESPEYIDYWTFRFADLFRVAVFPVGINPKWSQDYWEWIREGIATDKPYDQLARERIAAQGYSAPSRHYLPYLVLPPPQDAMGEQVRVFMGRRLDCAQCHDHPYEDWTQDQFWGMTAFFGAMFKLGGNPSSVVFDFPGGKEVAADAAGAQDLRVLHPRTKEEVTPTFLDGTVVPYTRDNFPRRELADWMTSHRYFSEATANRVWSYFFGRGIVDPVDDFRSTNPPTHPELLRLLGEDFAKNGYRLKRLFRVIVNSRTYQLSSRPNATNKADRINYSHALSRPLDAEVLLDAISDVTGVPETFSTSLPDAKRQAGTAPAGTRAIQLKETDIYYSPFLDLYGRPNRFSVPERTGDPNIGQARHILVGATYNEKLVAEGGRLDQLIKQGATDRRIIEELYLGALSRFPTEQEISELEDLIARTPTRDEALRDLEWAVLSSREFAENH